MKFGKIIKYCVQLEKKKTENRFENKLIEIKYFAILIFVIFKFRNIGRSTFDRWGSKFITTECRTTDISEFRNFEY